MRLRDFIAQNHGPIIDEWVRFASTLLPWANGMSDEALRDHAAELLSAVVRDMSAPQSAAEQADKSHGLPQGGALARIGHKHATERLATGFNLEQLVSEYRALRASILRLYARAEGDSLNDVTRFNEAIDESLVEATLRYSSMLENTREQFVAVLGHDLRTPLSAIVLGAQVLSTSKTIDERSARIATRILSSGRRMDRMISELLDLTRTRLGEGIRVTRVRMDLVPVCEHVLAELRAVHPDSELRFVRTGDVTGEWDSDRLTQLLSNLVGNALQHGEKTAPVTLFVEAEGDTVVARVHNQGAPIPEGDIQSIFEPMVRRPTLGGDRNTSGLGLGLFIAREIAIAHGGGVSVISTPALGTTFRAELPRLASASPASAARAPVDEGS